MGTFVIEGHVDIRDYSVHFQKSYIDQFGAPKISYSGSMVNNGTFWVISGQSNSQGSLGTFEIFKQAPKSQQYAS